ncbi:MAG: hypothetical protein V4506_19250 [Bacteroidota bacterium]
MTKLGHGPRLLGPYEQNGNGNRNYTEVMLPTNNQAAKDLALAMSQYNGVMNTGDGRLINFLPKPTSFTVTVTSVEGANDEDATINVFNNNSLTALDTDNGSGANSITYSWGDGLTGKGYEQLIRAANNGSGVLFTGFTLQVTVNSSGAQTAAYFNTMQLAMIVHNCMGKTVPFSVDMSEAVRNTQQQVGILTLMKPQFLSVLGQFQYIQPPNTKFAWTFFTNASSFSGN